MNNLTNLLKKILFSSALLLSVASVQADTDFNRTASTITTADKVEIYYKD